MALLAAIVAAFLFAEYLTSPIKQLSATAFKISRGQFGAKTGINRNDELGTLADSFDSMVDQLRDNIQGLNTRVAERTRELSDSNQQLLEAVSSLKLAKSELTASEDPPAFDSGRAASTGCLSGCTGTLCLCEP